MKGTIITKTKTNTIEPTYDNNENATTNTTNNNDIFFEGKIEEATAGLAPYYSRIFLKKYQKKML
jgi:carbohydrate-binding DOMON domain-containing protein